MNRKAIIISISGYKLSLREKRLIKKEKPWGIILFKRNIKTLNQAKKLTYEIRKTLNDANYPILIDEEGGKVSRLNKLFNNQIFSQKLFGDIYLRNTSISIKLYEKYIVSLIKILKQIGVNINTVPVLDVLHNNTHKVIGSRSYSNKINIIKKLGNICVSFYKKNKLSTVIKHIPGHGSASSDSHIILPIVRKKYKRLLNSDFKCFTGINSHLAMTAHVLYSSLDTVNCVSHSRKIINSIIRKKIKFKGILISDDISMKALKYNLIENSNKAIQAGCNLTLYCAGKYSDSKKLLKNAPYIDKFTQKKTSELYRFLS